MAAKTTRTPTPTGPKTADPLFIDFAPHEGGLPRHMQVRIPSPEQLAVWQSIGETFTRLGAEWEHQSAAVAHLPADAPEVVGMRTVQSRQAIRGINRSIKLIKSVLINEIDHEWVDDAVMDGATIEQMLGIVSKAVDAMRARAVNSGNTAAASTTKSKATLAE
jgi:hypothetical protein